VAFYGVERRRGGQPLVTKARKNPFVFLSVSLLLIAFLSMGFFSLQRLSRFGYVSQTSVRTNLLVRWSDGLFNLQYYLREYFGIPFCLIVLASLLLLPRLSPQRALFVLGYVGYQFILTLVYGNSFFARYLFGGFVPLSLLVGWVAASCGEAEGDRRLKGSAALFVAAWTVLSWSKSIASVIANPVHNAFSPSGGGAWPTRDYELYTIGAASGVGTAKLVDTIKWEQAKSPGSPVTVLGSDNFSPTGLSMRLLFFDDPQVRVLEGWSNRWDLPFSLASIWSSSPDEGSGSRMFLIATVYCESLYPTPCDEVAPQIPGAQLQLVREIGRADPHSRFQLFELKALYEEELEKLSPPDDGRYPDGLVAPTLFVSLPSESRGERWSLSGKVLAGTALRPEKIKMWEDEREISFTVQQAGELFTIIPQQPFRGSRLRIFFGNWQMQFDPFDHTTNYRNRQRAVSARDVKLVMQVR
jgi:hypothetical protein